MSSVTKYSLFELKKLTVAPIRTNNYNGKSAYVNYDGEKKSLILQTPKMKMPYAMSEYKPENGDDSKYTLSLAFNREDSKIKTFYDKMKELDNELVRLGVKNSLKWFKKKQKKEVIEALYSPIIKYYVDKESGEPSDRFSPTIKLKLPRRDGVFSCKTFNDDRELVDLETVVGKGATVQALIRCTGVWFAGGKFGVSWSVSQMKVTPNLNTLDNYGFIDSEDEDDEEQNDNQVESSTDSESEDSD